MCLCLGVMIREPIGRLTLSRDSIVMKKSWCRARTDVWVCSLRPVAPSLVVSWNLRRRRGRVVVLAMVMSVLLWMLYYLMLLVLGCYVVTGGCCQSLISVEGDELIGAVLPSEGGGRLSYA